jgi:hypothetical protein
MKEHRRHLLFSLLPERFAIVRLAANAAIPAWATQGGFFSVTRTGDEPSIVTIVSNVPEGVSQQKEWQALKVHGPFGLAEVGVLAAIAGPLAEAGISIFVTSTFDTDYLLVKAQQFRAALVALQKAGHTVEHGGPSV